MTLNAFLALRLYICGAYFCIRDIHSLESLRKIPMPSRAVVEDSRAQRGFGVFEGQPDVPKTHVGIPGYSQATAGAHDEDSNAR